MLTTIILAVAFQFSSGPIDNAIILDGYVDGKRVNIEGQKLPYVDSSGKQFVLEKQAAINYLNMVEAANRDGINLEINYSFRTNKEQANLYGRRHQTGVITAKPGHSNHQSGIAVDIMNCVRNKNKTTVYWWLIKNAAQFGYKNTIQTEPWHWQFSGEKTNI